MQSKASDVVITALSSPLTNNKRGISSRSLLTSSFSCSSPPLTAQIGEPALIAQKSCGGTTSASHPGIIVSADVGGLQKRRGAFLLKGKALLRVLGVGAVF